MNTDPLSKIKQRLAKAVNDKDIIGGGVSGQVGNNSYSVYDGYADIAKTKKFDENTIIRCASDSKSICSLAFCKLFDKGLLTGKEEIKTWIPSFEATRVIEILPYQLTIITPVSPGLVNVYFENHGLSINDLITLNVNALPTVIVGPVHVDKIVDQNNFIVPNISITTETKVDAALDVVSEDGTLVQHLPDPEGGLIWYKLVALKRQIIIWHILTHTLGYIYGSTSPIPGGYIDQRDDPTRVKLSIVQGWYFQHNTPKLPDSFALSSTLDIKEWADALAKIPLLFQPGESWSYGPQISLVGALVEHIDGRDFETYFREEITEPLGMKDTGFYVHNDNPRRKELISRFGDITIKLGGQLYNADQLSPGIGTYQYDFAAPKKLILADNGLYSTSKDRTTFFKCVMNGGKYKKHGKWEVLFSPALINMFSMDRMGSIIITYRTPPLRDIKWGLGIGVATGADYNGFMGMSKQVAYWGGFYGTQFVLDFGNDSLVDVSMNTLDRDPNIKELLTNTHYASLCDIQVNNVNTYGLPVPKAEY